MEFIPLLILSTLARCKCFLLDTEFKEFLSNFTAMQQKILSNEAAYKTLDARYQVLEEKYNQLALKSVSGTNDTTTSMDNHLLNAKFHSIAEDIKALNNSIPVNQAGISDIKLKAGHQSAFSAWHPSTGYISDTIRFDTVLTNLGNDYNATTGDFICEHPGTYMFTLTLYKYPSLARDYARCSIQKNGSNTIIVFINPYHQADTGLYDSSGSILLQLATGDRVSVGMCTASNTLFEYSTFSGFLVRAD